ncbi:MAG: hypothetical protein LBI39_03655 [Puniceicoccales bacterium]|nr:hypothetical protein [Puniceicoccales bacterium]
MQKYQNIARKKQKHCSQLWTWRSTVRHPPLRKIWKYFAEVRRWRTVGGDIWPLAELLRSPKNFPCRRSLGKNGKQSAPEGIGAGEKRRLCAIAYGASSIGWPMAQVKRQRYCG